MIRLDDPTTLSLLYHLNSEPWLNDDAYRGTAYHQEFKEIESPVGRVALPAAPPSALMQTLRRRQSCRAYQPQAWLSLESLSALALAAYGIVRVAPLAGASSFLRRTVPSAGGLFPLELFLFTQRVQGLADGLYHYDVRAHGLTGVRTGALFAALEPALYAYPFVREANVLFAFAAMFPRTQRKYGPRGYRYILLEAGHAAQNLCVAAIERGLATLCIGGFVDSALNRLIGLEPAAEGVVYAVAAGFPETSEPESGS